MRDMYDLFENWGVQADIELNLFNHKHVKAKHTKEKKKTYKLKNPIYSQGYKKTIAYKFIGPHIHVRVHVNQIRLNMIQ